MKTDLQLQQDVMDELQFEPSVDPADIGVAVNDGLVTLSGRVKSYAEKWSAVQATERLWGVKAVVDQIEVDLPSTHQRTDEDIARTIVNILQWDISVPDDRIKIHVENGWVILKGMVDYKYQEDAVIGVIRSLAGVKGITNHIKLSQTVEPSEVKTRVENAIRRVAEARAKKIQVEVRGHCVILRGQVHSWGERREAERAAWAAPGVNEVTDYLVIA